MHGDLKNIPKCSHSNILQSQWRNCGVIIDTDFLNYFNYSTQLFCKLFLTQLTRISIWIIISFIEYYRHIISKTSLSNYLPFKDICVYGLCRISDVTKALPCTWLAKPCIDFLQCMISHRALRKFASRFPLRNVSKRINSCHNRI